MAKVISSLFIGCMLILLINFIVQYFFPAPRWFSLCGGSICTEAQQVSIATRETFYNRQVTSWSQGALLAFGVLGFLAMLLRRWEIGRWFMTIAFSLALYPSIRLFLFEYGEMPNPWIILMSIGFGVFGWFIANRLESNRRRSTPSITC